VSPRSLSELALHRVDPLHVDDTIEAAVRQVLAGTLPALPVVDASDKFVGIFGEREFMEAVFPGYVRQLRHAAFLSRSLDDALERRSEARTEPVGRYMNTEHVDVGPDYSDVQVAEIFLHHRVLIVPVVAGGRIEGLITRRDFFRTLADRFVSGD
jgi:CBS domain-containing protein